MLWNAKVYVDAFFPREIKSFDDPFLSRATTAVYVVLQMNVMKQQTY